MAAGAFGIGEDADAVYAAVVGRAAASADDLKRATGLDAPRLRQALERLAEPGLVVRLPGARERYAAAAAETAWEVWLAVQEERSRATRDVVRALAARPPLPAEAAESGAVEAVSGKEAMLRRIERLQRSARRQVRAIDKPPYAMDYADYNLPREIELLGRGVRWRAIYDPAGLSSLHRLSEDLVPGVTAGEEARVLADPPVKLLIFDDHAALLPVEPHPREITRAVVVHPSALLEALAALFERLWVEAMPLHLPGAADAGPPQGPSPEELQLLGLLTAGLTDEVIARHLGVSVRTLHRRLRALQERLGARTRFQAALLAVRRGWLPIDPEGPPGVHVRLPPRSHDGRFSPRPPPACSF